MAPHEQGLSEPLHDSPKASVDVVLVHGLRGDRLSTWTSHSTFWPKDLLPKDIVESRIVTFGYDADIVRFWSTASQNGLEEYADSLVAALVGLRTSSTSAILRADTSSESAYQSIAKCTRRIAFLGTPHRGSDKAEWAETGQKFGSLFGMSTNKDLLKDMVSKSEKMRDVHESFVNYLVRRGKSPASPIELTCFFEEMETVIGLRSIGKIVSKADATILGYPTLAIHADHSNMCKFHGPDDNNYKIVAGVLERWAGELQSQASHETPERDSDSKTLVSDFSNSENYGQQFGSMDMSTGGGNISLGGAFNPPTKPKK